MHHLGLLPGHKLRVDEPLRLQDNQFPQPERLKYHTIKLPRGTQDKDYLADVTNDITLAPDEPAQPGPQ